MNAEALLKPTLENAREKNRAEADYINPDDGLLYCGHCHTPKEAYFPEKFRAAGFITHPLECECAAAKSRKEEAERKEYERRERIKKLRQRAFGDNSLAAGWRFEKTEIMTEALEKVKAYVDAWDKMREQQIGLLLLGNVGTGKTHAAACAANALINRQISVRFLHTTDLVQQMKGLHREDLEEFLEIKGSSVTSLLNNLERNGYLRREPLAEDARYKRLVPTKEAYSLRGEVDRRVMAYMHGVFAGLGEEELACFQSVVKRMSQNASK